MPTVMGWDIGGANTKAALFRYEKGCIADLKTTLRYFPIWRYHDRLTDLLRELRDDLAKGMALDAMGVTMTAELADVFRTKREGVRYILGCLEKAFPRETIYVLDVDAKLRSVEEARREPLMVAAANWAATAWYVGKRFPNALLIDVGSTTTDIIPILDGKIAVRGRNDLDRLISGELVYTGALRTNVAAIAQSIPVLGSISRVSSEYFAISADVHLVLGNISEADYVCDTPDGRPKTVRFSCERIARVVCADIDMLSKGEILKMARHIYERQLQQVADAIRQVLSRIDGSERLVAVVTGLGGEFIGRAAAERAGMRTVVNLADFLGEEGSVLAPSVAVAVMAAEELEDGGDGRRD